MEFVDDDEPPLLVSDLSQSDRIIPVTLLTGYLGSGKTTLLNYILTQNHGKKIAVIENEFSNGLGVEGMIAKNGVSGENLYGFFELPNGCVSFLSTISFLTPGQICCTMKESLISTLEQLLLHSDRFDYIMVESTGLANPGPVITSFWTDLALNSTIKLDGVICLVDCLNIESYLNGSESQNIARMQICFADRILLNKTDLINESQLERIKKLVFELNGLAEVQESQYSQVSLDFVLNLNCYDEKASSEGFISCLPCDTSTATATGSVVEMNSKQKLLNMSLLQQHSRSKSSAGDDVPVAQTQSIRMQGIFNKRKLQLALDEMLYNSTGIQHSDTAPADASQNSSEVSAESEEAGEKRRKTRHPMQQIYRLKGAVYLESEEKVHFIQAVHDIFDITESSYIIGGEEEQRILQGHNAFVIIGKSLDMEGIEEKLKSCLVDAQEESKG